jgi:hypothetical protein
MMKCDLPDTPLGRTRQRAALGLARQGGKMSKRVAARLIVAVGLILVAVATTFQLQHLVWSTARLENKSPYLLSDVRVRLDDAMVPDSDISPGRSRFVRLPKRGEATFSVEFSSAGEQHQDCVEYVEGEMYHVRATVSSTLAVSCTAEPGIFGRIMLLELL